MKSLRVQVVGERRAKLIGGVEGRTTLKTSMRHSSRLPTPASQMPIHDVLPLLERTANGSEDKRPSQAAGI